jgi:hypothetical protein
MTRISWWLVDVVSRALEPAEREAVRGDLAESREPGGHALRAVLGLVVRRQAALWKDWRPWVALVGLIAPLALLLSIVSTVTAGQSATYIWLYANNWDWAFLQDAAFWYGFANSAAVVLTLWLSLVCWSWTAGFVLGSLSRRIVQVYGVFFCLMLVFGELLGAPLYLAHLSQYLPHPSSPDMRNPVDALAFYRAVLPIIVQAALVAVPFWFGMRQGPSVGRLPAAFRVVLWAAAGGTLIALVTHGPGFLFFLNAYWLQRIWQSGLIRLLHFVVYWPVVYLAARALWHQHNRAASYGERT